MHVHALVVVSCWHEMGTPASPLLPEDEPELDPEVDPELDPDELPDPDELLDGPPPPPDEELHAASETNRAMNDRK